MAYEPYHCPFCEGTGTRRLFWRKFECTICDGQGKIYLLTNPELARLEEAVVLAAMALDTLKRPQNSHVCLTDLDRACRALRLLGENNG